MKRRTFVAWAESALALPRISFAQQPPSKHIGLLLRADRVIE